MDDLLADLLNGLSQIGNNNEEIYDTECRDRISDAIFSGFVRQIPEFALPSDFGLFSNEANLEVGKQIFAYISRANLLADTLQVVSFHARLAAFQNGTIKSDKGDYFDDFFGYSNPKSFNVLGKLID